MATSKLSLNLGPVDALQAYFDANFMDFLAFLGYNPLTIPGTGQVVLTGDKEVFPCLDSREYKEVSRMWHDDGLEVSSSSRVVNGANLTALIASQAAYLGKTSHRLDFYVDGTGHCGIGTGAPKRLCVESIFPLGGERVDLMLRNDYDGQQRYRMLGYNHVKRKGTLETLCEARVPIEYHPILRTPHTHIMLGLTDTEFAMAYALHMTTYPGLPIVCGYPGCKFIIRSPIDLRRFGGQSLCPRHFVRQVDEYESKGSVNGSDYLKRGALILPREPVTLDLWEKPDYEKLQQ